VNPRIPGSVWTALAALLAVVVVQLALAAFVARSGEVGWGMYAFAAVLSALLLTGLLRRSRLAWLWARWLALALAAVLAVRLTVGIVQGQVSVASLALVALGFVLPLAVAALALSRPSAWAFYGVVCPNCGYRSGAAADLLFRRARCRRCEHEW
jgi:hypothetical protein